MRDRYGDAQVTRGGQELWVPARQETTHASVEHHRLRVGIRLPRALPSPCA